MKKIIHIIFLFVFLSFPVALYAQSYGNDIAVTSGGSVDAASDNGKYLNSSSINEGIALNQKSFDYRLDSGLLASILISNPDIVFYDFIPTSSDTISSVYNVPIGVTVQTKSGTIRKVGYRISQTPPDSESGNFKYVYENSGTDNIVSVSTIVFSGFHSGKNYIQWYAQNNANEDGNTTTHIVYVGGAGRQLEILQPKGTSSDKPQIQATIFSPYSFGESSVTIKMCSGSSTSTVLNVENGTGKIVDGVLDYKYGGNALSEGQYTVWIEVVDSSGSMSAVSTFMVSRDPIPELLPYPSPYNPKKGLMNIKFSIADQASVTINIYDRSGKLVSQVLDSVTKPSGANKVTWNAKSYAGDNLANGVYICEIITKSGGKENKRYKSFAILRK